MNLELFRVCLLPNSLCCFSTFPCNVSFTLVDVPKVLIFPVGEIFKGMNKSRIHLASSVFSLVDLSQMPPQEYNDKHKQGVAAHMRGEGDEISRRIPFEEDLRT